MKYLIIPAALFTAQAFAAPQPPDMVEMFFKQLDADRNGKVSLAEYQKPTEAQFKQMDKNGDGGVDHAEAAAFHKEMMERARQMQQQMQQMQRSGQQHPSVR